jgi:hypothetical protein
LCVDWYSYAPPLLLPAANLLRELSEGWWGGGDGKDIPRLLRRSAGISS